MKKLVNTAFIYLIASIVLEVAMAGLIEATGNGVVTAGINPRPMALIIHTHLLLMGFIFFLLLCFCEKLFSITKSRHYKLFFLCYNIGLIGSALIMGYRSMGELFGYLPSKMVAMTVGSLAHIVLSAGLILFMLCFKEGALNSVMETAVKGKK